jgi:hypothetical protein
MTGACPEPVLGRLALAPQKAPKEHDDFFFPSEPLFCIASRTSGSHFHLLFQKVKLACSTSPRDFCISLLI